MRLLRCLPYLHGFVMTAAGQILAVRAPGYAIYSVSMLLQRTEYPATGHFPYLHGRTAAGQILAVRASGYARNS